MKKKVIAFTIADNSPVNQKLLKGFVNSLRKFHSEEELPLQIIDQTKLDSINDNMKFYRMTPLIARNLIGEYETVIKFDCDSIVTGNLSHLWEDYLYDVSCVLNGNPKEPAYQVWDIHPADYMNAGLVVMTSHEFIYHWWKLCNTPHFNVYQFKEQDIMNILYYYGDYEVNCLDRGDKWHGLVGKGWYQWVELDQDKNFVLKKGDRVWPQDGDKIIKVVHFAGGNDPIKGNYRTMFTPEVSKYIDYLIGDKK